MVIPCSIRRQWWIDIHKIKIIGKRCFVLYLKLDYLGCDISVCAGWFGFQTYYLAERFDLIGRLSSGAYFHWKQNTVEKVLNGSTVFEHARGFHRVHREVPDRMVRICGEVHFLPGGW